MTVYVIALLATIIVFLHCIILKYHIRYHTQTTQFQQMLRDQYASMFNSYVGFVTKNEAPPLNVTQSPTPKPDEGQGLFGWKDDATEAKIARGEL